MPKIRIIERDLSTAPAITTTSNIVYVPAIWTAIVDPYKVPVLLKQASDLEPIKEAAATALASDKDLKRQLELVSLVLNQGMPVLLDLNPLAGITTIEESGGWIVKSNDRADLLNNKNKYNIKLLTIGVYTNSTSVVPNSRMLVKDVLLDTICRVSATRKDCVALLEIPATSADPLNPTPADSAVTAMKYLKSLIASLDATFAAEVKSDDFSSEDTDKEYPAQADKYCAAFYPNVVKSTGVANSAEEIPGSFAYLLALAQSTRKGNPNWFSAAGSVRGRIPEADIEPKVILTETDVNETLEPRAEPAYCINAIQDVNPFGTVIWGNRTCYKPIGTKAASGLKDFLYASSFLNIRLLICDIKKTLFAASKKFTFEQNTDILWTNFKGQITPLLDEMKNNSGIQGYKIIRQTTDERAKLKCKIKIIPIEAVEDFDLTVEINDSFEAEVTE